MKSIKFTAILLSILLVYAFNASINSEQVTDYEPEQEIDNVEQKEVSTFLWELKKGDRTNYILGSIHLATPDIYPLHQIIEESFDKADILVLEADIGKGADKSVMELLKNVGYYQEGQTLKENLSPENYELISEKLKERGYDLSLFDMYKPWFLALTIMPVEMMKMGFYPAYGIDMYFMKKANDRSMEVMELEGIEYQLRLFDSFPVELQEMFLVNSLIEMDAMKEGMENMIEYWKSGDKENLYQYLFDTIDKEPALAKFYEKLNDERNIEMAKKINEYFQDDNIYFIVVGALHLIGDKGIIHLLEDKGYETKQLP